MSTTTIFDKPLDAELSALVNDVKVDGISVVTNGVANVPIASRNAYGLVKIGNNTLVVNDGIISVNNASETGIKTGESTNSLLTPGRQHYSTFYGLAKAAGDASQSSSSNSVGTYTTDALKKIKKMLGLQQDWELITYVTTTQDSASVSVITDLNGEPFALSEMYTRVELPTSLTGNADYVSGSTYAKMSNSGGPTYQSLSTMRYVNGTGKAYLEYYHQIIGNICRMQAKNATGWSNTQSLQSASFPELNSAGDVESINGIRFTQYGSSTTLIPSGTQIKIYGRRII